MKHFEDLLTLPLKILKYYDLDELSQLVLFHISANKLFDLSKAAYLVDNPDFDHLSGIAGFCKEDYSNFKPQLWKAPLKFKDEMNGSKFLSKIKNFRSPSIARPSSSNMFSNDDIKMLSEDFGMHNSDFCCWPMKHGNFGLLIFDKDKNLNSDQKNLLENAASFLSFCPIGRS